METGGRVRTERRLAAILAADVAGYSRLIGTNEEGTLDRIRAIRAEVIDPKIAEHHGRLVKTTGDGLLVEKKSHCPLSFETITREGGRRRREAHQIHRSFAPILALTRCWCRSGLNLEKVPDHPARPLTAGFVKPDGRPKYNFHSLRHFAASCFIEQWGQDVKRVQQLLGHASAQMTLDVYAALFPKPADDFAKLDAIESSVVGNRA
jgi:hypothetical protein